MKTQVAIIGGGPWGRWLSQLLDRQGHHQRGAGKAHAGLRPGSAPGVLEHGFADLMREATGVAERMDREGEVHEGFYIANAGERRRVGPCTP